MRTLRKAALVAAAGAVLATTAAAYPPPGLDVGTRQYSHHALKVTYPHNKVHCTEDNTCTLGYIPGYYRHHRP